MRVAASRAFQARAVAVAAHSVVVEGGFGALLDALAGIQEQSVVAIVTFRRRLAGGASLAAHLAASLVQVLSFDASRSARGALQQESVLASLAVADRSSSAARAGIVADLANSVVVEVSVHAGLRADSVLHDQAIRAGQACLFSRAFLATRGTPDAVRSALVLSLRALVDAR